MIKTYPNEVQPVVHTFYSLISRTDWESDDIVNMLKSSKGISEVADIVLDHFINRELNPINEKTSIRNFRNCI